MYSHLAPTYQRLFGEQWVLWFASSNRYSVVDLSFKGCLDAYLASDTPDGFDSEITSHINNSSAKDLAATLYNYLNQCHSTTQTVEETAIDLDTSKRCITKYYHFNGVDFKIHFDCELVVKTIHPSIAYLEIDQFAQAKAPTVFDIYLKDDLLQLFKDGSLVKKVPKRDYHLIQGKFIMELLCSLTQTKESDWIAALHGSTVADGNAAIMLIGESGKGKSTLTALLAASGFQMVADDVSPLHYKTRHIYNNPAAISIKAGAFSVLEAYIANLDGIAPVVFNIRKGPIKYVPFPRPSKPHYPCNTIVLVDYKTDAKAQLEKIDIATVLETLIPDSWIAPDKPKAKAFLDWLERVSTYRLTYSKTADAITQISELFQNQNSKK